MFRLQFAYIIKLPIYCTFYKTDFASRILYINKYWSKNKSINEATCTEKKNPLSIVGKDVLSVGFIVRLSKDKSFYFVALKWL